VNYKVEIKHFGVQIFCICLQAQVCRANVQKTVCMSVGELGVQHIDGPMQVRYWRGLDPCDLRGVDAGATVSWADNCSPGEGGALQALSIFYVKLIVHCMCRLRANDAVVSEHKSSETRV